MRLHYYTARLIVTGVEAGAVKINTSTLFWSHVRARGEQEKQMQRHYSLVKVKFLEVEVKLENCMRHYS